MDSIKFNIIVEAILAQFLFFGMNKVGAAFAFCFGCLTLGLVGGLGAGGPPTLDEA